MKYRYKFIMAHTTSYGGSHISESEIFRIESRVQLSDRFLQKIKKDYFGDPDGVRIVTEDVA